MLLSHGVILITFLGLKGISCVRCSECFAEAKLSVGFSLLKYYISLLAFGGIST
ncbi:hypothetical protein JG687_00015052 [Phytophthora cactorum]|uniref:Uncharacterized protein n=1 Tax=Phytophthora cactorum TaxID=29920 RepID=A0A329RTG8_9STRA|nr:hypothetical protein JG687_00015052 [Phytophthora cactorum]RAW27795.1 hypothetical protein PC110_g15805 [Phytophthora cactorum]